MPVQHQSVVKASHIFFWVLLLVVGVFHVATPLITVLFGYLVLDQLRVIKNKALALVAFLLIVSALVIAFASLSDPIK